MRCAVVTNYDITNYGSVLQAFALQKKLGELGAESYILQLKRSLNQSPLAKMKRFLAPSLYTRKEKYQMRQVRRLLAPKNLKLKKFCEENIRARYCFSMEGASLAVGDVQALIAGSDQIWSTLARTLSPMTLLQFGGERLKRYSYAASVGTETLDDEARKLMAEGLKGFSAVSVRESSARELIKSIYDGRIRGDLDPTLLYDGCFWKGFLSGAEKKEDYIFVYMLRPEPLTMATARALSKKTGLPIYVIGNRVVEGENIKNIFDAGAEDFLSYINNASYVVTNSFHGTAFAVQFEKQFLSIAIEHSGMRVRDFLGSIGLGNRVVSDSDKLEEADTVPDWKSVKSKLERFREESVKYLGEIVSSVSEKPGIDKDNITLYRYKGECTGCAACKNACPSGAIEMEEDEDGFVFPKIREELCIHCGLCKKVCNYQNGIPQSKDCGAYAAAAKEKEILERSASGGAFAAIAEEFLKKGGVVCGCEMQSREEGLVPAHVCIESADDLPRLQSSKYSQSEIGDIYKEVKKYLDSGREVFFSGTPCQVSGLRGFLRNKEYDNLYTADLICHGVPSTKLFLGYQELLVKQNGGNVTSLNFRDKRYGWGEEGTFRLSRSDDKSVEKKIDVYSSSYYYLFLKASFNRESCYSCRYVGINRVGDITLGDYWGIGMHFPELLKENGGSWDRKKGVSCILVNSDQGTRLLDKYGSGMKLVPSTKEKIAATNKALVLSSACRNNRGLILKTFREGGFEAVDKWFKKSFGKRMFVMAKWDKLSPATRKKIKKLKKLLPI